MPRKIFGPKEKEITEDRIKLQNKDLVIVTPNQVLFGCYNEGRECGWAMCYLWSLGIIERRIRVVN
jgi:hypothetical protein